jgi:DNA-binding response OmpR family regulator
VIAAASGHEALEAAFDASPDVLIADWMLKNHIHGLLVSEIFRGLHPQLNTILMTGFPSSDLVEESDRRGVSRLLEKPFDLTELHSAVDFALADPTRGEALGPPIAAMAISAAGALEFSTDRASELLVAAGLEPHPLEFEQVVSEPYRDLLTRAELDWVEAAPASGRSGMRREAARSRRGQRSGAPGSGAFRRKPPRFTDSHMYQAG